MMMGNSVTTAGTLKFKLSEFYASLHATSVRATNESLIILYSCGVCCDCEDVPVQHMLNTN